MQTIPYHYCLLLAVIIVVFSSTNQQETSQNFAPIGPICEGFGVLNWPPNAEESRKRSAKLQAYNPLECSVINGDVIMGFMNECRPEDYPVFRNLREITGFLLLCSVKGLDSLGRMFPNLRKIGGQRTVSGKSLLIYTSDDLQDIGLSRLERIAHGGVFIEENRKLCFANSINWLNLMDEPESGVVIRKNNPNCPSEAECELNKTAQGLVGCERLQDRQIACWNSKQCQRKISIQTGIIFESAVTPPVSWVPLASLGFQWKPDYQCDFYGPKSEARDSSTHEENNITPNWKKHRLSTAAIDAVFVSRYRPDDVCRKVLSSNLSVSNLEYFTEYRIRVPACGNKWFECRFLGASAEVTVTSVLCTTGCNHGLRYEGIEYANRGVVDTITVDPTPTRNSLRFRWRVPSELHGQIRSYVLFVEDRNKQHSSFVVRVPPYAVASDGDYFVTHTLASIPTARWWTLTIRIETDAGLGPAGKPFRFSVI